MPDIYTTTSVNSVQGAFDRRAYFALRPELYFDRIADVKVDRQTQPGSTIKFTLWADLAVASAALDESTDVDAVAMTDSQVAVTLAEYGNAVLPTMKVRALSFLDVLDAAANVIGHNAGISMDTIVRTELAGGSNVRYAGNATARNTVGPDDLLDAHDVRRAAADLRGANVAGFEDGLYRAFIHPDVEIDLREETGAAAWRDPHTYSQPGEIWNGTTGAFEGFSFISTPRAPVFADAGSSTTLTDVYATLFVGRQALAKAWPMGNGFGPLPKVILGPVIDKLKRFQPVGWYWLGGWKRFREAAIRRVESSSTIGTNA